MPEEQNKLESGSPAKKATFCLGFLFGSVLLLTLASIAAVSYVIIASKSRSLGSLNTIVQNSSFAKVADLNNGSLDVVFDRILNRVTYKMQKKLVLDDIDSTYIKATNIHLFGIEQVNRVGPIELVASNDTITTRACVLFDKLGLHGDITLKLKLFKLKPSDLYTKKLGLCLTGQLLVPVDVLQKNGLDVGLLRLLTATSVKVIDWHGIEYKFLPKNKPDALELEALNVFIALGAKTIRQELEAKLKTALNKKLEKFSI